MFYYIISTTYQKIETYFAQFIFLDFRTMYYYLSNLGIFFEKQPKTHILLKKLPKVQIELCPKSLWQW